MTRLVSGRFRFSLLLTLLFGSLLAEAQTFTFTNCGATGINGPTQAQANTAYAATPLSGSVTVTNGIQNWSVPVAGLYKIEVYGAKGYGPVSGRGAYMSGEFNFNAMDALKILVGQEGGCCVVSGTEQFGGGGGSFVVTATNTPLIIAGGGGGVNGDTSIPQHSDANITTNGNAGVGTTAGSTGGTNGGGGGGVANAGGGGGFSGDGGVAAGNPGGFSFLNGGVGGTALTTSGGWGGFGGGGGANSWNNRRGGGGGGYSGGGGAGSSTSGIQAGGGGGSFNSGANQVNTRGLGTGHGMVIITLLAPAVSVPNNTGVTAFPSLSAGVCPGNQNIAVRIRNFGSNFVDSVKIGWSVNGVFQGENWFKVGIDTFPVVAYDTVINIGSFNFVSGAYSIKAWTSMPNNQADTVNNNDTSSISITPRLAGTFTLNSAQPTGGSNYQTFSAFAADLSTSGVCGPVVLNVAPGSGPYNEQVVFSPILGASATNTITINGNGRTITNVGNATRYATFTLDGADFVTVKNLVIAATGTSNSFAVHITNGANNNTFDSCTITANTAATVTTVGGIIASGSPTSYTSGGANGSNNTISNCNITGGYCGISMYGSSTTGNANNKVINCLVTDFHLYGIYLFQQNGDTIRNSIFQRPTKTTLTTFYGIFLTTGCVNTYVEGNIVRNPAGSNPSASFTGYPIYVSSAATLGNENKIINNVVGNINGIGIRGGIYTVGATHIQIYHNTVVLDHSTAATSALYGIYATGTAGVDVRNNNISITQPSSGIKYGLYFSGAGKTSNFNNIHVAGGGTGANNVGFFSTAFSTLTNWKTANSGAFDQNSTDVDPMFAGASSGNFTPTNALMNDIGTWLGVATDINGAARSLVTPDVGAIEFSVAPCFGSPTAGTATVANNVTSACVGATVTVNLAGFSLGQGITIQWESSPSGAGVWTPIAGATTSALGAVLTGATDYRAVVTCSNGGGFDVSNTVTVSSNPFYVCYCSPLTGVQLQTSAGTNYVTNVSIPTTTLNASTSAVGAGGYLQLPFTVANNTASLITGQTYTINITSTSATANTELWIDWDQNGNFDTTEYIPITKGVTNQSGTILVPSSAVAGLTGLRIRNVFSATVTHGPAGACEGTQSLARETEDYVITVVPGIACAGVPTNTGFVSASDSTLCNGGSVSLTLNSYPQDLGLVYQWESSPAGQNNFTPISGATGFAYTSGPLSANTDFRMAVTCTNAGGGTGYSNVLTITVNNPQITSTTGGTRCGVGSVTLSATASAGNVVNWYSAPTGGAPLATNAPIFNTPVIAATDTFYAAANAGGFTANTGMPAAITTTNSGVGTTNFGLVFDVFSPFTLNTVTIYPVSATNASGTVTIDVINASGATVHTATVPVTGSPSGQVQPQTVTLNFNLQPGTNYKLRPGSFTGISGLLFEPSASAPAGNYGYPYVIPNVLSINTSTLTAAPTNTARNDLYYYFYNWTISSGCEGTRVPVVATVTTPPAYTLGANPPNICASGSTTISIASANNYSYSWTPTGSGSSFTVSPSTTTTYYVTGTDGNNCSISDSITINVVATPAPTTATASPRAVCQSGTTSLSLNPVPLPGIDIQWERNVGSGWTAISGATTATYVENVTATATYRAALSCNSSLVATSSVDTVRYSNPVVAQTFPGERCGAGPVTLAAVPADTSDDIVWFANATGGTPLATGNAYTTPSIATTTTYYAAASTGNGGVATAVMPPQSSVFNGNVRGYWFTAPSAFTITGLTVPNQTGLQSIAVVRFNGNTPPPTFSTTTNAFTTLFLTQSNPATGIIPVNIPISAGDVIGILGQRGTGTGYGPSTNPINVTIAGQAVPLTRMGMQFPLTTTAPQDLWQEVGATSQIGLTEFTYTVGCEGTRVPVTATINASGTGSGLAAGGTTVGSSQGAATTQAYTSVCNDTVAVINSGATALGNTSAIVLTSSTVQTHLNKPFVPRAYDINPSTNGAATVTLYALQSEFTAYNNYVTSNSLSLPLLPTGPTDVVGMSNIVITQFHGSASAGNQGPLGLYSNANVSFIPNSAITVTPVGTTYWRLTFPVTGFSGFFIHSGVTPLAIDLTKISATNVGSRNRVDWMTAIEEQGDRFELERSADGSAYRKLAEVSGKGSASSYSYWDESPVPGINYYRLKLISATGETSYSRVVTASVSTGGFTVEAFPNPVKEMLTVKVYGARSGEATLTLTDITGKLIRVETVTADKTEINMHGLAQGFYLIKYQDGAQSQTIKITKQ